MNTLKQNKENINTCTPTRNKRLNDNLVTPDVSLAKKKKRFCYENRTKIHRNTYHQIHAPRPILPTWVVGSPTVPRSIFTLYNCVSSLPEYNHIRASPFGLYCITCESPLSATYENLHLHLQKHQVCFEKKNLLIWQEELSIQNKKGIFDRKYLNLYLSNRTSEGFVCECGSILTSKKSKNAHVQRGCTKKIKVKKLQHTI